MRLLIINAQLKMESRHIHSLFWLSLFNLVIITKQSSSKKVVRKILLIIFFINLEKHGVDLGKIFHGINVFR